MPPRLSLQPLSRQLKPCTLQQRAAISSTARNGARTLQNHPPQDPATRRLTPQAVKLTSPTKELIDMDDGSSSSSSDSSDASAFNNRIMSDPLGEPVGQPSGHDHLSKLLQRSGAYKKIEIKSDNTAQRLKDNMNRENLARQSTRNWKPGDIYAPHDLSPQEMIKWKAPKQPTKDIIDMLGLNPLDHYRVSCCPVGFRGWHINHGCITLRGGWLPARKDRHGMIEALRRTLKCADPAYRTSPSWPSS